MCTSPTCHHADHALSQPKFRMDLANRKESGGLLWRLKRARQGVAKAAVNGRRAVIKTWRKVSWA